LHCNGPVLRRKEGRESDSPVHRSLGSLLCPSSRVNDREALLRKFRVKLRLKLLPAVFPLGSAVPKLLISHNISHADEAAEWEGAGRVSDFGSSVLRQQRLAGELRRLRKRARLTGKEVATRLGWSEAKLSRIENGLARVKTADLDEFMDLYEVSAQDRVGLRALAEESRQTDPLEELEGGVPEGYARIIDAEREAEAMQTWEPQVVPGLLQTEGYTRALLQPVAAILAMPTAAIERRVESRLLRQRVLTRTPPLELLFAIDESVLIRGFAPPSVMRDQLTHLVEVSEDPNIELRILPLSTKQVVGTGAFVYFRYPKVHGVSLPDAVALEHLEGTVFIESEQDVNAYRVVYGALRESSLSPEASRDMLGRVARETWQ
jgi:transcriptional regulator with XRE-family HTH domain